MHIILNTLKEFSGNWTENVFGRNLYIPFVALDIKSRLECLVIFLLAEFKSIGNFHRGSVYKVEIHIPSWITEKSVTVSAHWKLASFP